LRRGKFYDVRRYPATVCIQTNYDKRPEGYDRLASYIGGSNSENKRIDYLSPTIMQITGNNNDGSRKKVMRWPVLFAFPDSKSSSSSTSMNINNVLPEPTIPRLSFVECPEMVVAVSRFEVAATEPVVKGYTLRLQQDLASDGIAVKATANDTSQVLTVAQYDALFSLNKRRNEVWLELADGHPWSRDL